MNFTLRTPTNMSAVLEKVASAKTKGEKQRILVKYGLHNIPVRTFFFKSDLNSFLMWNCHGVALFVGLPFF